MDENLAGVCRSREHVRVALDMLRCRVKMEREHEAVLFNARLNKFSDYLGRTLRIVRNRVSNADSPRRGLP